MKYLLFFLMLLNTYASYADYREKIVVIDTGLSEKQFTQNYICKNGAISAVPNVDSIDRHGHGTNIIGLIAEKINPSKQCIVSIKVYHDMNSNIEAYLTGLKIAVSLKPTYVNISMNGPSFDTNEFKYLFQIIKNGGIIAVAAGNENINLDFNCDSFPACYKDSLPKSYRNKFFVVSSKTTGSGNTGSIVSVYLDGKDKGIPKLTGTSQSTAIFTSLLISK